MRKRRNGKSTIEPLGGIAQAGGNWAFSNRGVVVSLVSRLNFLRAQSLRDDRWRSVCANEIGAILDALDASNPAAAHAATAGHILSTCQAARDAAITSDRDKGGDRPSVPPRSLPRIPLDDYLDRGLAPNDAPAVHERRGRRSR